MSWLRSTPTGLIFSLKREVLVGLNVRRVEEWKALKGAAPKASVVQQLLGTLEGKGSRHENRRKSSPLEEQASSYPKDMANPRRKVVMAKS